MSWRADYKRPKYASVEAYLTNHAKRSRGILNNGAELRAISRQTGLHIAEVRGGLKRLGYKLEKTVNGIEKWRLPDDY